jgi:hypothetical protein
MKADETGKKMIKIRTREEAIEYLKHNSPALSEELVAKPSYLVCSYVLT